MVDAKAVYNETHDAQGYVAYDTQREMIIVAVRGTKSLKNWIEDVRFWFTDYELCAGCKVENGFLTNFRDLKQGILEHVTFLKNKYPQATALLTGHSLGGATVTVAALYVNQIVPVKIIETYGSPRVGNPAFANHFNEVFKDIQVWRVVNYRDPVPHLPLQEMGYQHVNTEIWYNSPNAPEIENFDTCPLTEEPYCSNSVRPLQFIGDDHNTYIGINMNANC